MRKGKHRAHEGGGTQSWIGGTGAGNEPLRTLKKLGGHPINEADFKGNENGSKLNPPKIEWVKTDPV